MKKQLPFIFLMLFSMAFMIYFYGAVIFSPNQYFFSDTGDAIKNYFTYAYHIDNPGSDVFNFTGMNYPFGENIFFTDSHPALLLLFKLFSNPGNYISTHSIGILNTLLLFSVFLTFFAVYYLMRELRLKGWICVAAALSITVLAPQLFRIGGHLALSYSVAIPISWLLLLLTLRKRKYITATFLFLNILFWLFIHAYLGVIIISFLFLIIILTFIAEREKAKSILQYSISCACILLPLLLFYFTVNLSDSHSGRTDNPTGFFLYNAEPDDIFIPHHPPLKPLFDGFTRGGIKQEWEAWSYVGISTGIILLVILLFSFKEIFMKNKSSVYKEIYNCREINYALIASLILLLFAMAVPFRQFPVMLEAFPILKQFRATGRFTWPFYFVILIFVSRIFYIIYSKADTKSLRLKWMLIVSFVNVINIVEGIPYHREVSASIIKSPNLFDRKQLSAEFVEVLNSINSEDYQSILPLPFYYQGSESFSRPRMDETVKASIIVSYHKHLPLFSANLTRTSVAESKKIVQLVSPGFYEKDIIHHIDDPRPFLIVCTGDKLSRNEENILSAAKIIYQGRNISVYSLDKSALFADERMEIAEEYIKIGELQQTKESLRFTKDSVFYFRNNFDDRKSEKTYQGKGGFKSFKKGKNVFAEFKPNTFSLGKDYIVRLWLHNNSKDALNDWFRLIVEEFNEKQNTWISTTFYPEQCETINGEWSMAEFTFTVGDPSNKISLVSIGKEYEKQTLFADELLIMEADADVYSYDKYSGTMFFNNHTFKIPESSDSRISPAH